MTARTPSFAATITDFQTVLQGTNTKTLTARVSFLNKLNRPLVLGYVRGAGIAVDDRGNRYGIAATAGAVQGIGEIVGNTVDPKLILQAGEASDARFEFVWNASGREIFGVTFQMDLAIREIDPVPGNQFRLGREYALHFTGLGDRQTTAAPPAAPTAPATQADACAGRPRCYSAGPFVAEVVGLTASSLPYAPPLDVLQARVRFRNLTNQPLILGYVAGSAVMMDDFGSRFTVQVPAYGDGAKGIGVVQREEADTQFVLTPGGSGEATFTLSHNRAPSDRVTGAVGFEFTIAQLEVLPSRQVRTVREYSVILRQLSAGNAGTQTTTAAPPPPSAAAPEIDACGAKPRCYSAGPFMAEVTGVTSSSLNYAPPVDVVQVRMRLRNLTNQPVVLAYVGDSAVMTDSFGSRYTVRVPAYGDGAKGMGVIKDGQADTQFVLKPGASGDVAFTLSRARMTTDRASTAFNLELTIAQLEVLDSRQVRTVREYAVGMRGLTASGPGILNKLLQSVPK